MTFEDFVSQTNIKDVVKQEQQKQNADADVCLSDDDMHARLEFFYKFRTETDRWHINAIKNLKFNECKCKQQKSNVPENDFADCNAEGIDELMAETRNAKTFRDIGVQCSSTNRNTIDANTSIDNIDLQSTLQLNSSEGNDTNAKCSDKPTDCTNFPDINGLVCQIQFNEFAATFLIF